MRQLTARLLAGWSGGTSRLIGKSRLDPAIVTSDVIAWDQAADRYLHPALKLVVAR